MPSLWRQIRDNLEERLDEDLLPALYAAVSLPTSEIRAELDERQVRYFDPLTGDDTSAEELEICAEVLIQTSERRAGVIGAAGAVAGAVAVPPEVLASMVHSLRLAQRLAVLYGFDPETDAGRILLWRAIGAAYGVTIPEQGSMNLKVRDLPNALGRQVPTGSHAAAWVTRKIVYRSLATATKRITRLVPGLGMGVGAWSSRKLQRAQGEKMRGVFQAAWSGLAGDLSAAVEAEEIL